MDYLKFRDNTEVIDSKLLTKLVQKHNVEYVTKPLERRQLWLSLTREYNGEKGTSVTHARLAKRWHNMKQRARKQITDIKRSVIRRRNRGAIVAAAAEDEKATRFVAVNSRDEEDVSEGGVDLEDVGGGEQTKQRQDALLRDLLICLARKYRVDEPKRGASSRLRMWTDVSREYHRLSGGILNANSKQLQSKWNNIKFNARQKGKVNPYDDVAADQDHDLEATAIAKQLVPFKLIMEDEQAERDLEAQLQQNYLFASAMHGHKLQLAKGGAEIGAEPPPVEPSKKRTDYEAAGAGCAERVANGFESDAASHARILRNMEKQIYMETLHFEQERLKLLIDNSNLERQKLLKDIELSEIQLQKAKIELERM